MSKIGTGELLVILIVALIIFGPSRLPALGKMAGKALGTMKHYINSDNWEDFADDEDEEDDAPAKSKKKKAKAKKAQAEEEEEEPEEAEEEPEDEEASESEKEAPSAGETPEAEDAKAAS